MARRINFGGQSIRIPGAYSQVNADALSPAVLGAFNRAGVIASSTGGLPKQIVSYLSPSQAESDLISGNLLDAMKLMWTPSPQQSGASEILAVRVDPATQGEATLYDSKSVAVIGLKSRNYGTHTENIKVSLTDAVDGYGKKVEIWDANDDVTVPEQSFNGLGKALAISRDNSDGAANFKTVILNVVSADYNIDEFKDNAGTYQIFLKPAEGDVETRFPVGATFVVSGATLPANDQAYTVISRTYDIGSGRTRITVSQTVVDEAGSAAQMDVQPAHKLEIYTDLDAYASPEITLNLELQIYNDVYKIAEFINGNYSQYNVRIVGDSLVSRRLSAVLLDSATQTLPTVTGTFFAESNINLVVNWINANSDLVVAEVLPGATILEANNTVETSLEGGFNGVPSVSDWEDAIRLFEAEDVQLMCIMTDDLGVQLALKSHIEFMSTQGRSERRGYLGHPLGDNIEDVKDRALALSSRRVMLLSPGVAYQVNEDGDPELMSSAFAGAIACGMAAGSAPQTPLTNKQLGIVDLEKSYLDSEIVELLDAGVAPIKYDRVRGLFKFVQGQTTWLKDDNSAYKEDSVGRIGDFISLNVRRVLEDRFVGSAAETGTAEDIRITVTGLLMQFAKAGLILNYGEVSVRIEGTIAYVEYQVAPSEPLNFILITTRFIPSRLAA